MMKWCKSPDEDEDEDGDDDEDEDEDESLEELCEEHLFHTASASSLLVFFMSRKRTIDSSRSCEGRRLGKTFFSTISSSDQI